MSESFQKQYGIDPKSVGEYGTRWTRHQARYFTELVRKVHTLVKEREKAAGRNLEFVLEGQGGFPGPNQDLRPRGRPRTEPGESS